jgi:glycosyltransferase involved in cell wall biosynthesis
MPVRKVQWSADTEVEELKDMDIGIMPLRDDLWSWGKCGLKILQYFGVAVPAVCTPVGVNRDVVQDGVNGFWAMTDQEWIDKLSILIEDSLLRQKMGQAARITLEDGYTVESNYKKVFAMINGEAAGENDG